MVALLKPVKTMTAAEIAAEREAYIADGEKRRQNILESAHRPDPLGLRENLSAAKDGITHLCRSWMFQNFEQRWAPNSEPPEAGLDERERQIRLSQNYAYKLLN